MASTPLGSSCPLFGLSSCPLAATTSSPTRPALGEVATSTLLV